uniref:Uncharacterized protein n=1 Tax=Arundo donax TaxID=35708 RepID=A0A0A9F1C0_ARUDO
MALETKFKWKEISTAMEYLCWRWQLQRGLLTSPSVADQTFKRTLKWAYLRR